MKLSTKIIASLIVIISITASCKSSSETTEGSGQRKDGERPNIETLFAQMDANKDGKISKSEAKGPLSESFSKIDTNEDGFISKEELKKAPKPERRQRPRN